MKITDVSSVDSLAYSNVVIIDCIHEHIKDKKGYKYETFILNKNNELIAHFESHNCITVSDLDETCNLFVLEDSELETDTDHLQLFRIEKDNTYTYLNTYEYIEECLEDGCFAVKRNGLYGFINSNGEEIIEPQYDRRSFFKDGYALVRKNKKWGLIDKQNNIIVPLKYTIWGFPAGGYVVMKNFDSTIDVYNLHGEIVYQAKRAIKDVFNLGNGTLLIKNKDTKEYEFVNLEK